MKDWGDCVDQATNTPSLSCIPYVFQNVVFAFLLFSGIVAVILIIISGFKFANSGGDPKQVEGARHTLTYAIIGFVVILLSFAILNFIATVTGTTCITKFGFNACTP